MFLSGCATNHTSNTDVAQTKPELDFSQEEKWYLLTGTWYSSQATKEGGIKQEIMQRSPQGNYKVIFRIYDKDSNFEEQTETGYWGVSGPVYFTILRGWIENNQLTPSSPSDPYNHDAYKIINLTSDSVEYENYSSGNRHTHKKVADSFYFPEIIKGAEGIKL